MTELIGELSESDILRRILARTPEATAAVVGPGDDAAVLALRGDLVATTDTLVHGPDFRLAWSSGFDLGYKAAAVNLADIAAMGARPTALLVALAIPASLPVTMVEEMADGLAAACAQLAPGCAVVGGDLTVSATLTIAVTALGDLEGRGPVLRSGAMPGDTVAIAGAQGVATRGLSTLFRRFTDDAGVPITLDLDVLTESERREVRAQLRPEPPIALGVAAAQAGASAMMDVSDGLVLDARRMARASGVTIDINSQAFDNAAAALEGGEDHSLLATFSGPLPQGFRAIGRVLDPGAEAVTVDEARYDLPGGWDPYRDWDAQAG
ncbi:thiamine-phosphate kinase [Microbacterium mitrae]|uniref:Thiamine-monophosphate kinase n=1 Tax=Microbacterium mitrae TaxID=664640 RepID=A0A5C8HP90_9MICO|nr:thiamine-phosphate kinase [Microbacterium mitrae]TXK05804.1 thiamine-phosphate kinase [Microbacterium mitrae]